MTTVEGIHLLDPEALGYSWAEWNPKKRVVTSDDQYTIFRSARRESQHGTVQHSVRRAGFEDDVMRVDSYREGYFSAFWHSGVSLDQFLTAIEHFLARFESPPADPAISPEQLDERYTLDIFRKGKEQVEYTVVRPITEEDFRREGLLEEPESPLSLLRMNTPYGDFCFETDEKRVGVIAVINEQNRKDIIAATTEFVCATQPVLSQEVVNTTLNRVPYIASK